MRLFEWKVNGYIDEDSDSEKESIESDDRNESLEEKIEKLVEILTKKRPQPSYQDKDLGCAKKRKKVSKVSHDKL